MHHYPAYALCLKISTERLRTSPRAIYINICLLNTIIVAVAGTPYTDKSCLGEKDNVMFLVHDSTYGTVSIEIPFHTTPGPSGPPFLFHICGSPNIFLVD